MFSMFSMFEKLKASQLLARDNNKHAPIRSSHANIFKEKTSYHFNKYVDT